jgi:hypothetical protein
MLMVSSRQPRDNLSELVLTDADLLPDCALRQNADAHTIAATSFIRRLVESAFSLADFCYFAKYINCPIWNCALPARG